MVSRSTATLGALRRRAAWLAVALCLGVCVPVLASTLQAHASASEEVVDLSEKEESTLEALPSAAAPKGHVAPPAQAIAMADAASPPGCTPDAPPTPPPDRRA